MCVRRNLLCNKKQCDTVTLVDAETTISYLIKSSAISRGGREKKKRRGGRNPRAAFHYSDESEPSDGKWTAGHSAYGRASLHARLNLKTGGGDVLRRGPGPARQSKKGP